MGHRSQVARGQYAGWLHFQRDLDRTQSHAARVPLASVTVTETLCPTSNATVEANKLTNASVGLQCDYLQQKTDA